MVLNGTMTVMGADGTENQGWWLAPPGRAVWVAPDTDHSASYSEESALVQVLLPPALFGGRSLTGCRTLSVPPLLRELALEAARLSDAGTGESGGYADLLARLTAHQINQPEIGPGLFVPQGQDRRLRRVTERLHLRPELDLPLDRLAVDAGSSGRTLARLFVAETGMTFSRWRDHLRVVMAVDRLVRGQTITQVALDLGYQSPSSFTTMFTRLLGEPPGRYLRRMRAETPQEPVSND